MLSGTKTPKKSSSTIVNLGLIISLGNCCIGYTGVCLSSIQHLLQSHNRLSQNATMYQLSIATASLNFGAIIGALFYKKFQDKVGTLRAFMIVDMLCLFFLAIQLIDLSVYYLVAGRFLYGIFMTMSLAMTPNFLNKMSKIYDPSIKGTLGSFNQLLIVCGMIVSYMMAYILPRTIEKNDLWDGIKWRLYIGMPIVFILIRLRAVLTKKEYQVVEENLLIESQKVIPTSQNNQVFKFKQKASYKKRLIVGILVIASNQLSCINGILFYARQMMDMVTNNDENMSKILMLFLAFGQLLASMMSGKLLNKFQRKKIFIKGQQIIIIILFLCFFFDTKNPFLSLETRQVCMGILINLHVIVFNLTLGPMCIFYCSQILNDLKYIILTLKCLSLFFALTSDIMIHKLGIGWMFMIFGVISMAVCLFLRQEMKETMDLEKEKVHELYIPVGVEIPLIQQPEVNPLKVNAQKHTQTSNEEPQQENTENKTVSSQH